MDIRLKEIIHSLRQNGTETESQFWNAVRNRKLKGYKFLRQHSIRCHTSEGNRIFIADFYCAERKLVVEIDGPVHTMQQDYDELRTQAIEQKGLKVIRFTNDEISRDISIVISKLIKELDG